MAEGTSHKTKNDSCSACPSSPAKTIKFQARTNTRLTLRGLNRRPAIACFL